MQASGFRFIYEMVNSKTDMYICRDWLGLLEPILADVFSTSQAKGLKVISCEYF